MSSDEDERLEVDMSCRAARDGRAIKAYERTSELENCLLTFLAPPEMHRCRFSVANSKPASMSWNLPHFVPNCTENTNFLHCVVGGFSFSDFFL